MLPALNSLNVFFTLFSTPYIRKANLNFYFFYFYNFIWNLYTILPIFYYKFNFSCHTWFILLSLSYLSSLLLYSRHPHLQASLHNFFSTCPLTSVSGYVSNLTLTSWFYLMFIISVCDVKAGIKFLLRKIIWN